MRTAHGRPRFVKALDCGSKRATAAATLVATALLLASCSSSGSPNSSTSTTGAATTTSGTVGGDASTEVAAAEKIATAAEQPITSIPSSLTPLKSKPDTGKLYVWMACDAPSCQQQVVGAKDAAAAAGWNFKVLNWKLGDPSGQVSALLQALQLHPTAVGITSLAKAQFPSVIPAYQKAGVMLLDGYSDGSATGPIITNFEPIAGAVTRGKILGNWFIADSNGTGNALDVSIPEIPSLDAGQQAIASTAKAGCSKCSVTMANFSYADVTSGKAVSGIVSKLLQNHDINYVLLPLGPMASALTPALKNAGLAGKVKLAGIGPEVQNLQALKAGTESAWIELNQEWIAWIELDAALRHLQGLPIDDQVLTPERLLTKGQTFDISPTLNEPAEMADQFKKLWLVNS